MSFVLIYFNFFVIVIDIHFDFDVKEFELFI